MAISGDVNLDANQRNFSLPSDTCCVGGSGPSPEQVANISQGGGKASAATRVRLSGGDPYAGGRSVGKARAQQASEKYTPGSAGMGASVPVGYDGPVGNAGIPDQTGAS